jgi:hypothetical protein
MRAIDCTLLHRHGGSGEKIIIANIASSIVVSVGFIAASLAVKLRLVTLCTIPVEIAKAMKSISAVYIFTKFPDLKKRKFWGSGLWSKGTFYSSVGGVSEEAVKRYIETHKDRV